MFNKDDFKAVNAVRTLSVAQIEKANSGHPGLPMGASPMAYALFNKVLKANPKNPCFFDRDRFCLLYTSPSPRDRTRSRMPSSA